MSIRNQVMGAAGASSVVPLYVEDVFSQYVYKYNGSTQSIAGPDMTVKGGMIWTKARNNGSWPPVMTDTSMGLNKFLITNQTTQAQNWASDAPVLTSTGYNLPVNTNVPYTNYASDDYISWMFRNEAKFKAQGTYVGNGNASQTISHSLKAVPGFIIVKNITTNSDWFVYHPGAFDMGGLYGIYGYTNLNTTGNSNYIGTDLWTPTATTFQANGSNIGLNTVNNTYVYHVFAHNAGGFGAAGTDNIISCGAVTIPSSGTIDVNLGYEPQWLLLKQSNDAGSWFIFDTLRGWSMGTEARLFASNALAETSVTDFGYPTASGFNLTNMSADGTFIYVAIRRPMKVPTDATKVFAMSTQAGSGSASTPNYSAGFPVDVMIRGARTGSAAYPMITSRLRGTSPYLITQSTAGETADSTWKFDSMSGYYGPGIGASSNMVGWMFKRATGFCDELCYSGNGAGLRTIQHNLGVVPEFMIVKELTANTAGQWCVYHKDLGYQYYGQLESTTAFNAYQYVWKADPTSTVFSLGGSSIGNNPGSKFDWIGFASCPGVSKVGSYTGNGSSQTINCGFSSGARFVVLKRTDSDGNWWIFDTFRGINSGADSQMVFNNSSAEYTGNNFIDPHSSGFTIKSGSIDVNTSGGTYIFLAIA